jgi:hypothetical protein
LDLTEVASATGQSPYFVSVSVRAFKVETVRLTHGSFHKIYYLQERVRLSRDGFIRLLEENAVPPAYIQVYADNNGTLSSQLTFAHDSDVPSLFRKKRTE